MPSIIQSLCSDCELFINPLSTNPRKWSNTVNQFVGCQPTNCLSVFDHFMGLALRGLRDREVKNYFAKQWLSRKFYWYFNKKKVIKKEVVSQFKAMTLCSSLRVICNINYYDQTFRHFLTRSTKHLGSLIWLGNNCKVSKNEKFNVLDSGSNKAWPLVKESKRHKTVLIKKN